MIGTATVSGGSWSIADITALSQGGNPITAKQTDQAGNTSVASTALLITLDTIQPAVTGVAASDSLSLSGGNGDLNAGRVVTLTATFSEAVTVAGGAPTLTLDDGGTATYLSGSGTSVLVFRYTVAAGDTTPDLAIMGIALNGATILDAAGNAATLTGAAVNPAGTLKIDTTAPVVAAIVATGGSDSVVSSKNGDHRVTGTAEADSTVTLAFGSLTLGNTLADASGNWFYALTTANIASIGHGPGKTVTATATDAAGNTSIASPPFSFGVNTIAPKVTSVAASGSDITNGTGNLNAGKVVTLTATFSKAVTVAGGVPTLTLDDGGTATYLSGSGTSVLVFRYTVAAGDTTPDLTVTGSALNGATILDAAGNAANLTLAAVNPVGTLKIDTTALLPENTLTITDTSTNAPATGGGNVYTGPVAGIQYDYITITTSHLNVATITPNWFIHTGSGDDAIDVSRGGGANVLDGSTGSNFLVGGSGNDTFFVDERGQSADVWSTIVGFHAGDEATLWGVTPNDFTLNYYDNQGATGYTGIRFGLTAAGKPNASLTIAGYTSADLSNGRLTITYGTTPDLIGLPGSTYMLIHGN